MDNDTLVIIRLLVGSVAVIGFVAALWWLAKKLIEDSEKERGDER